MERPEREPRSISRPRAQIALATVLGGLALAILQPVPYAALLAVNAAVAPEPGREAPVSALGPFWASPARWVAVLAWALTVGVLLARPGRPSGGRVGLVPAAAVTAYVLVGGAAQAAVRGGGVGTVYLDGMLAATVYGTAWLAGGLVLAVCWWVRRFA